MTDGHVHPTPDAKQEPDWNVTNLTETGGWTVMEFERKQSTSDIDDHVIGVGTIPSEKIFTRKQCFVGMGECFESTGVVSAKLNLSLLSNILP